MGTDIESHFASIKDDGDLLRPITPDMNPEEAMARLQEYNRRDMLPATAQNRLDHLRKANVQDPETWEFYSNEPSSVTQEESLEFLHTHWPDGIESLHVPGQWFGAVTRTDTKDVTIRGWAKVQFKPEGHSIYLRLARHV
jgi:hypothetical protein